MRETRGMTRSTAFGGFPAAAITFYEGLEADNSRDYWLAHKDVYTRSVRAPMEALLGELEQEFGAAHLFRPNRDVRFSADKSPYKDHQGAIVGPDTRIGLYLAISADGLIVGGGFRAPDSATTRRFRQAVDAPDSGLQLQRIVAGLHAKGFQIDAQGVATAPRGYPRDHPRIQLLRLTELKVIKGFGTPRWLATGRVVAEVRDAWREILPLRDWAMSYVAEPNPTAATRVKRGAGGR
jgi:uncharacterized protein (TIGR02453 family)